MNYFGQLGQQLRQLWTGMNPARRVGMVAVLALAMAVVLGVGYWAAQPDYRVLYSGLAAEDSNTITTKLQAQNVPYRLEAGGTTILVPAESLQQMRVTLAAEDLPAKGGKGWDLFDQSPLGMTPFTQDVNYVRALQAELARTIMQIEPIVFARVHLVRSQPSLFLREQKPTTASVIVRFKAGAAVQRKRVAGIVALVSRGVEGLSRENVTVVDAGTGRTLSEQHDPDTGAAGSAMDQRRELEQYLSARAESMLEQVVGRGRALVRVTADVDREVHKEQTVTYLPDGKVTAHEVTQNDKNPGGAKGSGGPAGTASNIGKGSPSPAGSTGASSSEMTQTDYLVSKITKDLEHKAGRIERLTIAALVDLSPEDKDGKSESPLSLADAQDIIKQAVGFKTGRDDIKVTQVKLAGTASHVMPELEWETLQRWQTITTLVRHGSLGLAALAALIMGWMVLRRLRTAPSGVPVAAPTPVKTPVLERLSQTAEQNPEALAHLAQWLEQSDRPQRMAA